MVEEIIKQFNLSPVTTEAISKSIRVILILVFMTILIKISIAIIDKFVAKQKNMRISFDEKKANTLGELLKSIVKYGVYFIGIMSILNTVFGTISITFAGIGGVAIGLGAQNLIKDIINGFFIIFEDQFAVGDYINIGDKGGVVESIGLRLTKLKDFNGDIHIIPNGSIAIITNHSRADMRVQIDIEIAHEEDVDKVIEVLQNTCNEIEGHEDIVETPKVVGIASIKESGVVVRVAGKAKPMTQWDIENLLRKKIKKSLDDNNIQISYPKRKIFNVRE